MNAHDKHMANLLTSAKAWRAQAEAMAKTMEAAVQVLESGGYPLMSLGMAQNNLSRAKAYADRMEHKVRRMREEANK